MKNKITKRYLLFAGFQYYPRGGVKDFVGSFDTIDEAVKSYKKKLDNLDKDAYEEGPEWLNMLDTETGIRYEPDFYEGVDKWVEYEGYESDIW